MHIYAEYFNASQSRIQLRVVTLPDPAAYRNSSDPAPDLIIQQNPAGAYRKNWFSALELDVPDGMYSQLKEIYLDESGRTMLPVAFSLPVMVWHGQKWNREPPLTIGLNQLAELNRLEYETVANERRLTRTGFSPLWNRNFPLWYMRSQLIKLAFSAPRSPAWHSDEVIDSIIELRDWIEQSGSEIRELNRFRDTYMYPPYYALLRQGRIDYYPVDLREYQRLPGDLKQDLDFAWFGNQGKIPVLPNMIYAAIPAESRQKKAAEAFLKWLSLEDSQRALIEHTISQGLPLFGLFGGLSAIVKTNEQAIPHYFPEMYGKAPVASRLIFPPLLPSYWRDLENNVLAPAIREMLESPQEPRQELLESRIQSWIDARGEDE
ncbi:hypothetical protein JCM12856_06250 [Spirochaeta dissipatitropha]